MLNLLYRNKKKYIIELAIDFFFKNQKGVFHLSKLAYTKFQDEYKRLPSRVKESVVKDINSILLRNRHVYLESYIKRHHYIRDMTYTHTLFLNDGYDTVDIEIINNGTTYTIK